MDSRLPFPLKPSPGAPSLDEFGFAVKARRRRPESRTAKPDRALFAVFVVIAIAATVFQKIGFAASSETVVPLLLPITFVALAAGIAFSKPVFVPSRVGLYLAFILTSGLSTALFAVNYSGKSLALYAALYLPMIVSFRVSEADYRRCLDFFSTSMVGVVGIVALQHLVQLSIGWQYWPNLDRLLPASLIIPNFNYVQPIVWGMNYMKPNGIFFLEVSFLSQFIALALGVELVLFRRWKRILLFTGAVFVTFAGTGVLLLLLTLPFIVGRISLRNMALLVIACAGVGFLAWSLGWIDLVSHRFNEFGRSGASANMRFVEPYNRLVAFVSDPSALYSGIGAGQIEKALNFQWWPITKAVLEYGIVPGLLFYAFFLHALFHKAPSPGLSIMLAVWFSLEGALLTAVNPITCVLLSTMFILDRGPSSSMRRAPAGGR